MSEICIDRIEIDKNVSLSVYNEKISINIKGLNKLAFVNYTEELFNIIKNARFRIPDTPKKIEECKYIYSNEQRKYLHQVVFDYYIGEENRKKGYKLGYIIEHLDNNGFNCDISNLFLLKKVKNTYKGWNFDKESKESVHIIALKIYHIIQNKTFQITIAFNQSFVNERSGKAIETIKLLYDYNYEIVLQDAEQILESIVNTGHMNFGEWKELYRFKDIKTTYCPEIDLSDEEKKQDCGTIIVRDGINYLIVGHSEESIGLVTSIPYDKNWNFK